MGYHLRIKICGVTTVADAVAAAELGADAVGLNFYLASPRCIDVSRAREILQALPPFTEPIGLFVEEPLIRLCRRLEDLPGMRTVQWHGARPEVAAPPQLERIVAFSIRDAENLAAVKHFLTTCRAVGRLPRAVLLDAHVPGLHGGTGQTAPWDLLADFRPGVPLILAGGLTPENVAEAVRRVRPFAVDVASGVESSPGQKDLSRIRRFITAARQAALDCP